MTTLKCKKLDVEIHDPETCNNGKNFIQAKFLVHGFDDVMWTDSIEDVIAYIKEDLEKC